MSVQIEKWIFTVDEYHRMTESGILTEDDRVELIEGEIIKMSPIGKQHAACVNRLNAIINRRIGHLTIVSVQNPVRLNDYSEPEPDIALLKPRNDFYSQKFPCADDVLLIIEVADTSLDYDRNVKLPLYAESEIPEIWLVNLADDNIERYTQPVDGIYNHFRVLQRGEIMSPEILPELLVGVGEIIG